MFIAYFLLKISRGPNGSQISYVELLITTSNLGKFSDLIETGTYEKTILGTLTMFHSSGKESKTCIHRIEKKFRNVHGANKFSGHQA